MHLRKVALLVIAFCCLSCIAPSAPAQTTSVPLFGPVDVRPSQSNATYQTPLTFNTNTLTLTCPATPTAVLSGTTNGSGPLLVDNNIFVSSAKVAVPENVCQRDADNDGDNDDDDAFANCFKSPYQKAASAGSLTGLDLDTAVYPGTTISVLSTGGVPAINIGSYLSSGGPQTITISLKDEGDYVANSTIYFVTNCTVNGVQNGGNISGNPITSTSSGSTSQDFSFNPVTNQQIGFSYDLSGAYSAGTINNNSSGAIPQVSDSALAPASFPTYVAGTSFATSNCFVHTGELLNGQPSCKLFTLTCTSSATSSTAAGAYCPVSTIANEILQDQFDGPGFTLKDISTSNGTFHEGIGFLMASEGWPGGACVFDSTEPDLANDLCPRNLLTSFTGPGAFTSGGTTTHPNSTFISVWGVPEDLTTVSVTNASGTPAPLGPGNWTKQSSPYVVLSSQPPNLSNAGFVAAPVQSITYGISPSSSVPVPGTTSGTDTVVTNSAPCPSPSSPGSPAAKVFTTSAQSISSQVDGTYLLHYFAQDCAGTQELKFEQDATGSWTTNFYTFPINIDTVAPQANTALSAPSPYYQGQVVTASYSCSDPNLSPGQPASGVVTCGTQSFNPGIATTGNFSAPISTSVGGQHTFTVNTADAAGNTSTSVTNYAVNIDSQIFLAVDSNPVTYPSGPRLDVQVQNLYSSVPTGTVVILDNGNPAATLMLKNGKINNYLNGLSAGQHSLNAHYLGDGSNPAGYSAAVALTVLPAPVSLSASCGNSSYLLGTNVVCSVSATDLNDRNSPPQGVVTYSLDGGAPISVPLTSGVAQISINQPPVGNHSIVINYPAQTNFAAAGPVTANFVVVHP